VPGVQVQGGDWEGGGDDHGARSTLTLRGLHLPESRERSEIRKMKCSGKDEGWLGCK